jgi:signal transduction histidine kinase
VRSPLLPVTGNEAFLTQIISNLLGNAVKFVERGTVPKVEIGTERIQGNIVRFWVKDNGIGIDPRHHSRIFEIFGRVHPDSKYEGTGIGLAIVKKSVERINGRIGFESELGKGTVFWVELPIAALDTRERPVSPVKNRALVIFPKSV